ncbi:MAG: hypothetical protein KA099_00145 [Alphaproteobacteria bacterium]|nr:hypothetical protein [Alphaproteobacteria bacterium]MBP7758741.1 hypothetical protein [Alphaproteobacteria bacterium]MBP7761769.1 hypothetical protein [Alphaproteobacteria bacterium]MBP7903712.1 hypothetical protein [Alphaproteobacteria bacterium]
MTDFGLKREMVASLVRGEQIQTLRLALSDLVDVLNDVNELSSTEGISENARSVTDKATLEAVRRIAQEEPLNDVLADRLVFCLIGVSDVPKRQEAFETVFPYLSPEGQVDLLNEMRDALQDNHELWGMNPDDELTGLLAKHIRPSGGGPLTVGEVLRSEANFTLGPGNTLLFQPKGAEEPPVPGAGPT